MNDKEKVEEIKKILSELEVYAQKSYLEAKEHSTHLASMANTIKLLLEKMRTVVSLY